MPKSGDEPFHQDGQALGPTLLDFWRWSASDLVVNTMRGLLAEYIVGRALGLTDGARIEWEAFDLITPSGLKAELKSAAYLQSWQQGALSAISFVIRPTRTLTTAPDEQPGSRRRAEVYIFCLLHHRDKATVDPLDLSQWTFYVLPTAVLDERCPFQKTIGLAALRLLHPIQTDFAGLASAKRTSSMPATTATSQL